MSADDAGRSAASLDRLLADYTFLLLLMLLKALQYVTVSPYWRLLVPGLYFLKAKSHRELSKQLLQQLIVVFQP